MDYGEKRIGLAMADSQLAIAHPLKYLERKNFLEDFRALLEEYGNVEKIIVGLPKRLSGELGPAAQKVIAFTEEMKKKIPLFPEVVFWDERMTTALAEKNLIALSQKRKKRKETIDQTAAYFLLQNYLEYSKRHEK